MNLDYSSLDLPVADSDLTLYRSWARNKEDSSTPLWVYITSLVVFAVSGFVIALIMANADETKDWQRLTLVEWGPHLRMSLIIMLSCTVIFFALYKLLTFQQKITMKKIDTHRAKLLRFSKDNKIKLYFDVDSFGYQGALFDRYNTTIIERFVLPDGTHIGNLKHVPLRDKDALVQTWQFVQIPLPRYLPHILLDSRYNNLSGGTDSYSPLYGRKLQLEGDFDKYFTLIVPESYERDALYIFTPDVMMALMETGHSYDMEIIDNNMLFYTKGALKMDSEADLSRLLSMVERVKTQVITQAGRYTDERIGNKKLDTVAMGGKRLRS